MIYFRNFTLFWTSFVVCVLVLFLNYITLWSHCINTFKSVWLILFTPHNLATHFTCIYIFNIFFDNQLLRNRIKTPLLLPHHRMCAGADKKKLSTLIWSHLHEMFGSKTPDFITRLVPSSSFMCLIAVYWRMVSLSTCVYTVHCAVLVLLCLYTHIEARRVNADATKSSRIA